MSIAHLTPRDYIRQAWKNGGGTTTELSAHVEDGARLWRVSVADVTASGPFSDFSGFERTIMLLEGNGMVLAFDQAPEVRLDRPYLPFTFDGAWRTDCRLIDGPVRDLNLIVDRKRARGTVEVAWLGRPVSQVRRADWTLVYALAGAIDVGMGAQLLRLEKGHLLRLDGPEDEPLSLTGHGVDPAVALVEVRRQRP